MRKKAIEITGQSDLLPTSLHIYLLGHFRVERDGQRIRLPRRKVELLLAYLLLHPEPHARSKVATLLWDNTSHKCARQSLRMAVATLRQLLGEALVLADREHLQLNPQFPLWVDLRALLAAENEIEWLDSAQLATSAALWQADLLAGTDDHWVRSERERLEERISSLFLQMIQTLRARSEYQQAIDLAQRLLTLAPLNEQAHQHLIFCYSATGARCSALRQYEWLEQLLRERLNRAPSPATVALYRFVKESDRETQSSAAKITNLPLPRTSFVGRAHALSELQQLLTAADTRLLTLIGAGGSGKTRLAIQVATQLLDAFADGVWWVDLTGVNDATLVPVVVAKTFGLQRSEQAQLSQLLIDFLRRKELLLVVDNCEHLIDACHELLAQLLECAPNVRILATSRAALHIAGEALWQIPALTLPERTLLDPIDESSLKLLLQAEAVRLFLERAQKVRQGFQLNAGNAHAIVEICERLDGIPLAIELAAARVRVLSVHEVAAYLTSTIGARFQLLAHDQRSVVARQQTLFATIDWSYRLLSPDESQLFRQTAVFQGSFSFEALEQVTGCGLTNRSSIPTGSHPGLHLLTQLIDKSLIIAEPGEQVQRYRLLESVREFALHAFTDQAELQHVQQRHACYFMHWAQHAAAMLQTVEEHQWLAHFSQEYGNLHAALLWFEQSAAIEAGLRLSSALAEFWRVRGYLSEGQRWLTHFLERASEGCVSSLRINAQTGLAWLYFKQGKLAVAQTLFAQSLTAARAIDYQSGVEEASLGVGSALWEVGDNRGAAAILDDLIQQCRTAQHLLPLAVALNTRSLIDWTMGELSSAAETSDEAVLLARQVGKPGLIGLSIFNRALLYAKQGDFATERALYEEVIWIARQLGDEGRVADALINLGLGAINQGEFALATAYLQESAELHQKLGDQSDVAYSLNGLAMIAFHSGNYAQAHAYHQQALTRFRAAGNKRLIGRTLADLGWLACRQGDFAAALKLCGEAIALAQSIGHKSGLLFCLEEGFAELAVNIGQPHLAVRLLAVAEVTYEEISIARSPLKVRAAAHLRQKVQQLLGETIFLKEWNAGQTLTLDDAVALAQGIQLPTSAEPTEICLRFFGLGPAHVWVGKRQLTAADWTYAKARELVFYLLCNPGVTQAEIGLHFWPDANKEQVRKRFSAALSHARSALGRATEFIVRQEGRYSINPACNFWFDVTVFEAKLQAAQCELKQRANRESVQVGIRLLEEALDLYQGDFVQDLVEGEWPEHCRTRLAQAFVDALVTLAECYALTQQPDRAIVTFRRALAKDPYAEEAHVGLIRALASLGKRTQALQQAQTLSKALADLGVAPTPQTQQYLRSL